MFDPDVFFNENLMSFFLGQRLFQQAAARPA